MKSLTHRNNHEHKQLVLVLVLVLASRRKNSLIEFNLKSLANIRNNFQKYWYCSSRETSAFCNVIIGIGLRASAELALRTKAMWQTSRFLFVYMLHPLLTKNEMRKLQTIHWTCVVGEMQQKWPSKWSSLSAQSGPICAISWTGPEGASELWVSSINCIPKLPTYALADQ